MNNRDVLGKKIKIARIEKGLSQSQLAALLNVSINYISLIENGKRYPSLILFEKISKELSVSKDELIKGDQLEEDLRRIAKKYSCDLHSLQEKLSQMKI